MLTRCTTCGEKMMEGYWLHRQAVCPGAVLGRDSSVSGRTRRFMGIGWYALVEYARVIREGGEPDCWVPSRSAADGDDPEFDIVEITRLD